MRYSTAQLDTVRRAPAAPIGAAGGNARRKNAGRGSVKSRHEAREKDIMKGGRPRLAGERATYERPPHHGTLPAYVIIINLIGLILV